MSFATNPARIPQFLQKQFRTEHMQNLREDSRKTHILL